MILEDTLSNCCDALVRYLDCEECKRKKIECIWVCTECGEEHE